MLAQTYGFSGRTGRLVWPTAGWNPRTRAQRVRAKAAKEARKADADSKPGLGLKAVWFASEQLGNLLAGGEAARSSLDTKDVMTREEAVASIREDYDADYFVSGNANMAAYTADTIFRDDFSSFKGVERFKKNVSNLGAMLEELDLDILEFKEIEGGVRTRWRFSGILTLPWRPRLAAAGTTTHILDPATGKVQEHIEEWQSDPKEVVRRLLKPSNRLPTNQWEVLMLAVSERDGMGVWFAVSGLVVKGALPVVAASLVCKVVTGSGLPGVFLGGLEGVAWLALVVGCCTEGVKFARGMGMMGR